MQRVGICKTCPGDLVCCDVCNERCHNGHVIEDVGEQAAYCDCGEQAGCGSTIAPLWPIIDQDEQSLHTINSTLHMPSVSSYAPSSSSLSSRQSHAIAPRLARREDMFDLAKLIQMVWIERQLLSEARAQVQTELRGDSNNGSGSMRAAPSDDDVKQGQSNASYAANGNQSSKSAGFFGSLIQLLLLLVCSASIACFNDVSFVVTHYCIVPVCWYMVIVGRIVYCRIVYGYSFDW